MPQMSEKAEWLAYAEVSVLLDDYRADKDKFPGFELLEAFTSLLTKAFPADSQTPSVNISTHKSGKIYIAKSKHSNGQKEVSSMGTTISSALERLMQNWLADYTKPTTTSEIPDFEEALNSSLDQFGMFKVAEPNKQWLRQAERRIK